jgi:hypothetical protein
MSAISASDVLGPLLVFAIPAHLIADSSSVVCMFHQSACSIPSLVTRRTKFYKFYLFIWGMPHQLIPCRPPNSMYQKCIKIDQCDLATGHK